MDRVKSWLPLIILLAVIHLAAAGSNRCMYYVLTIPYFDSTAKTISNKGSDTSYVGGEGDLSLAVGCSSTYMNKYTWGMYVSSYSECTSQSSSQFGFGIWVKFLSTLGAEIFTIGDTTGDQSTYKISSTAEGTLTFTYSNNGDTTASDALIDVPHNSWTFLTLYWVDNSFKVYLPGKAEVSKKSSDNSKPFSPPNTSGKMIFGKNAQAYFYELVGFQSASISGDVITLSIGSQTYTTETCPAGCADTYCIDGTTCISSYSYCSSCDENGCLACGITARDPAYYCTTCPEGFCCSDNCSKCSSATVCTECNKGYFLYDKDTSTTCASCINSCSSCGQSPSCFECADSISKDGETCRVDSIGFQISFSSPNIVIDLAHPLSKPILIDNLKALASDNSPITTSTWTLSGCSTGSLSCKIVTDNLSESMLPISIDFSFNQDS